MSDDIKVVPTPIQRNCYDVAVELTKIYVERSGRSMGSPSDISEVFAEFFAIATLCNNTYAKDLKKLLPDNLKDILHNK